MGWDNNNNNNNEDDDDESPPSATTILLRVRRPRRGAITASSTLRLELDAAMAAADDAFNECDIHSSYDDDEDDDQIPRINESSTGETKVVHSNSGKNHHRVSVSSRSRQSVTSVSTLTTTTSTAIFRRIESSSLRSHTESTASRQNSFHFHPHKRPRILDAVLLANDDDDDDDLRHIDDQDVAACANHDGNRKRRRLTLQILEPQKVVEERQRRRSSRLLQYPILSPQQRQIDDSLQQVFAGTVTLPQHCQLIHESSATAMDGVSCDTSSNLFWPYVWCQNDGNWLHAAAMWNEAAVVREMFHILEEKFDQLQIKSARDNTAPSSSHYHQYATLIRDMIQTHNCEGLNPLQVAQLCSNSEVHAVLEHYYLIYNQEDDLLNDEIMDDDDHQYELYSLVLTPRQPEVKHINVGTASSQPNDIGQQLLADNNNDDDDPVLVTNCELHNGCRGYWDERGNLILEAPTTLEHDLEHDKIRGVNQTENLSEEDIDSNDEDWDGNDYPDDEDDHEFDSDDEEQASGNENLIDFRRRHVNLYSRNQRNVVDCNDSDDYDDDAHYDPSYGDIYGQSDSLYR